MLEIFPYNRLFTGRFLTNHTQVTIVEFTNVIIAGLNISFVSWPFLLLLFDHVMQADRVRL